MITGFFIPDYYFIQLIIFISLLFKHLLSNKDESIVTEMEKKISKTELKDKENEAAKRLNEAAEQLRKSVLSTLQQNKECLAKWGNASPQSEAEKDVIFGGRSGRSDVKYCPDGQYVVGMQVIDRDGGKYCISCISGVRFICRPIGR